MDSRRRTKTCGRPRRTGKKRKSRTEGSRKTRTPSPSRPTTRRTLSPPSSIRKTPRNHHLITTLRPRPPAYSTPEVNPTPPTGPRPTSRPRPTVLPRQTLRPTSKPLPPTSTPKPRLSTIPRLTPTILPTLRPTGILRCKPPRPGGGVGEGRPDRNVSGTVGWTNISTPTNTTGSGVPTLSTPSRFCFGGWGMGVGVRPRRESPWDPYQGR